MHTLRALKRSPLGLDLYFWLVYKTFTLHQPLTLSWRQLYRQFGASPAHGGAGVHQQLSAVGPARVQKNQTGMAGPGLSHRHGRAGHRAVAASYRAGTAPSHGMTRQLSRLEWWTGVTLVVLAILAHALVPRYEYRQTSPGSTVWVRVDRWTGQAIVVSPVSTDGITVLRAP